MSPLKIAGADEFTEVAPLTALRAPASIKAARVAMSVFSCFTSFRVVHGLHCHAGGSSRLVNTIDVLYDWRFSGVVNFSFASLATFVRPGAFAPSPRVIYMAARSNLSEFVLAR